MPIQESVTIDEVVEVLNRANELDPHAMRTLVAHRVACNENLVKDPTIQVMAASQKGPAAVGLVGIVNGLFGVDEKGWGPIAVVMKGDSQGTVKEFMRIDKEPPPDPVLDPESISKVKPDA